MFGAKIVCEQCSKKMKEKKSFYRRGSRFCSEPCITTWEAANPPPVARGSEAQLREELVMLIEQAHVEAQRTYHVTSDIGEAHAQEAILTNCALYQSYTLRSAPIL